MFDFWVPSLKKTFTCANLLENVTCFEWHQQATVAKTQLYDTATCPLYLSCYLEFYSSAHYKAQMHIRPNHFSQEYGVKRGV